MNKVSQHKAIVEMMNKIYQQKQNDYGDSFGKSHKEYGAIAAIVRMDDKLNRAKELLLQGADRQVSDEKISDTLIDLANYSIMLAIEVRGDNK